MTHLSRREFLVGTAAAAATVDAPPGIRAQKRGGTLRFVPAADLKILDPIWTTSTITRNHAYMIYDTLFGTDAGRMSAGRASRACFSSGSRCSGTSPSTRSGAAEERRIPASSALADPRRTRSTPPVGSGLRPWAARSSATPRGGGSMKLTVSPGAGEREG
jgi:peptide/nickel transport system substrate-binding protein